MPPAPRFIKLISLLAGLALVISALVLGIAAVAIPYIQPGQKASWILLGFEIVILVAGVLAVLFGRGKYAEGPGLALALIAATVMAGSAFGFLGAGTKLGTISLMPIAVARVLLGCALGAAAAYCVLVRNAAAWRVAWMGVGLGMPFVAIAGAVVFGPSRRAIMSLVSGGLLQTGVAVVGAAVIGGLLCASVHMIIKAFEMGRVDYPSSGCPQCGYDWGGLDRCPECGRTRAVKA